MPILRLAYSTQFLIALMAVFVLWSQVGGQSHLDLLAWPVKLVLGVAAAYGVVRATAASVSGDRAWNGQAVRWLGFTLAVLAACGYATYYAHMNLEETDDADQPQDTAISRLRRGAGVPPAMPVSLPAFFEERRRRTSARTPTLQPERLRYHSVMHRRAGVPPAMPVFLPAFFGSTMPKNVGKDADVAA